MANLIQDKSDLEERLNKHGSRLYNLENLNIPQKVSKAIDEIITDVVDCAMQAPLRARFSDLPTVDMKKILQQWMFEDNSYKAHEVHKNLFEALQKSLERDYSNQLLADLDEARRKKRKKCDSPRTPSGSPPPQPPPPPPPTGMSSAPGTSGVSGSSQLPPPPPPLSTDTNRGNQYESSGLAATQETSPTDYLMNDDSIPDEQWKPLPEEERPATPEPGWTIPSSNVLDVEKNWATALVSTYVPAAENSLLAKTGDMTTFINCSRWRSVTRCLQIRLTGRIRRVIKLESMSADHCLSVVLQCQSKCGLMKYAPMTKVPLMVLLTGGSIDRSSILRDM
ncbi:hypothetical protein Tco_1025641, partial [Tanacetum coccineum]